MHYFTIQSIKFTICGIALFLVFAYISDEDYRKIVDKVNEKVYNCDILLGDWHPDVPLRVIEKCRELRSKNVSTFKE